MAVHVVDHPLVRHKLGILRKESTSTSEFRMLAKEIARLLMYEATKQFKTEKRTIKGWAGPVEVESISGKMVTIVPILRAGLGLMDGVLDMVPGAKISVVGLYRNEETLEPVEYYVKLAKEIDQRIAIILDPMLATGGSLIATIDLLKSASSASISCALPKASSASRKRIPTWTFIRPPSTPISTSTATSSPASATPGTASSERGSGQAARRCLRSG